MLGVEQSDVSQAGRGPFQIINELTKTYAKIANIEYFFSSQKTSASEWL